MDPVAIAVKIANRFAFEGKVQDCQPVTGGLINDTFRLIYTDGDRTNSYILQMMNRSIFTKPAEVMENIAAVTDHLRKKAAEAGGDPDRETLTVIPTRNGESVLRDDYGEYWRAYRFISNTAVYEMPESEEMLCESGRAFGRFGQRMADFPAGVLHEILPGFHDTKARYDAFIQAVAANLSGRLDTCIKDVVFLEEHSDISRMLAKVQQEGKLPLRVTHNDTRLNNILFDYKTGKAACVIDLDTVMSGLSAWDFGDTIRICASTAAEDEENLDKVRFDLKMFEAFAKGYIEGWDGMLTEEEYRMLPYGALVITYEQALRYLSDYINGDMYYKTEYPAHNLVRARTQIQLVKGMERSFPRMQEIVEQYRRPYREEIFSQEGFPSEE